MESFWKGAGAVVLAVILGLALGKQEKHNAILLTTAVCVMVAGIAIAYLSPVVDLLRRIGDMAQLDQQMLGVVLKTVGIGMIGELACMICRDSGNGALERTLQLLTTGAIFYLALPLLQQLLDLLQEILGGL